MTWDQLQLSPPLSRALSNPKGPTQDTVLLLQPNQEQPYITARSHIPPEIQEPLSKEAETQQQFSAIASQRRPQVLHRTHSKQGSPVTVVRNRITGSP